MPRDLRADTTLVADPTRRGRFRAEIPDDWKVVFVFGGVSMYTALRAMQEALGRAELDLVTANDSAFTAEVNYASAEFAMAQAYLGLRQSVGLDVLGTELR